jgi:hypothetical protein
MEINLIKSNGLSKEVFTQVMDLLQSIDGPLQFTCDPASVTDFSDHEIETRRFDHPEDFRKKKLPPQYHTEINYSISKPEFILTATWETLFDKCSKYRREHGIANDAFVILLTAVYNKYNWFSAANLDNPYDGFVHTEDWDHYLDSDSAFPIAYEVLALVLQKFMFKDKTDMKRLVHEHPLGCVNDLCMDKHQIILKLRTADICGPCMTALRNGLSDQYIKHARGIMESLRLKMLLSQNFLQNSLPSKMHIDRYKRIWLTDFGNLELRLNPTEKSLYLFYLRHTEGVAIGALPQHKQEIFDLYSSLSLTGTRAEMQQRVDTLVSVTGNAASENISRIKKRFTDALGLEVAVPYCIQGPNGGRKSIRLDRNLVLWEAQ